MQAARGLSIKDRRIPEVDLSHFFSASCAAEQVLTWPQKQDLRTGAAATGTLNVDPWLIGIGVGKRF